MLFTNCTTQIRRIDNTHSTFIAIDDVAVPALAGATSQAKSEPEATLAEVVGVVVSRTSPNPNLASRAITPGHGSSVEEKGLVPVVDASVDVRTGEVVPAKTNEKKAEEDKQEKMATKAKTKFDEALKDKNGVQRSSSEASITSSRNLKTKEKSTEKRKSEQGKESDGPVEKKQKVAVATGNENAEASSSKSSGKALATAAAPQAKPRKRAAVEDESGDVVAMDMDGESQRPAPKPRKRPGLHLHLLRLVLHLHRHQSRQVPPNAPLVQSRKPASRHATTTRTRKATQGAGPKGVQRSELIDSGDTFAGGC
ncbi:hypothetical protein D9619_011612 [Psilocybe cf. subviscida]|uniref:Uncharacterized protein n=1 Tax=Psilocybe cf. subviscida TaxID=2480587 RepID=A0A8H5BSR3_9AGAR|nr:hypothetical protein D9619_011612 [Psilocybe cf. subviscida]